MCSTRSAKANKVLFVANGNKKMSTMNFDDLNKLSVKRFSAIKRSWLWHRRLGHAIMKSINKLSNHDLVVSLPKINFGKDKYVMHDW